MRLRLRLEDLEPALAAALAELVAEPALADAGLGDDADHGPVAGLGSLQRALENGHLLVAADEAGEAALAREVEPRARRADPRQLEDSHRLTGALDLELGRGPQARRNPWASSAVLSVR